jgi:chromosome partitioning protein
MGKPASELNDSIADFYEQTLSFNLFNKDPADFAHKTPFDNLYVIPSSPELDFLERKLEAKHKIYKLKNALRALESQFDEIIIDTAPALNFYTRSGLIACDKVLIPFDCDDFARQALYNIMGELQDIQEDHNDRLEIEGIVVNQFQPRASLPARLVSELEDEGLPVLPVKLNASVKMKESHQVSQPLIYFAPNHALTQQFEELYEHLSS